MTTKTANTWQEELANECKTRGYSAPVFNIVSDRRGGRTAWSATVTVNGQNIAARYWYDGQYLNNAKEDAAEVACTKLRNPALSTGPSPPTRVPITSGGGSGWNRLMADDVEEAPREEEKVEPKEEPMPEGAIARVGEEILD